MKRVSGWIPLGAAPVVMVGLMVIFTPSTLQAKVYKNPAAIYGAGKYALGVDTGSLSRDYASEGLGSGTVDATHTVVNVTIGVGDKGSLGLHYGSTSASVDGGTALSGGGGGLSFQYALDPPGASLRKGLVLSHFWGYVEDDAWGVWYAQTDAMFGMSKPLAKSMNLYFGGGLSLATLTLEQFFAPYYTYEASGSSSFGGFAGVDFVLSAQALVGLELHLLHESGVGVYVDVRF
ncbi:MAG: hypothetical protein OEW39_08280 [Deltaproteobacteria bacterium]|nr:hypothetical protein [Deltaproteobacteria bacterium]